MWEIIFAYTLDAWEMLDLKIAALIFVAYFFVDILYVRYTLHITRYQPLRAASAGSLIYLLLSLGVIHYTQNALYLIPLIMGAWVGTYSAVRLEQKQSKKNGKQFCVPKKC